MEEPVLPSHAEVRIDEALVRGLLADQFPLWADLPLTPVPSIGLDNAVYRLGADLAVRLPRRAPAAAQAAREQRWVPALAPALPLAVPVPVERGTPTGRYPWPWSVCRWLPGETAATADGIDAEEEARALAGFVNALRAVDPTGGPRGELRGVPLAAQDDAARTAVRALRGRYDAGVLASAWEAAVLEQQWSGPPAWFHGDLHPGNLLVDRGRLCGVVDFGLAGVGDPACDLMPAWTCLTRRSRQAFRAATAADDATWRRGRGWALLVGLLACSRATDHPVLAGIGRRTLTEVLADDER